MVLLALALATTAMWVPVATADTRTSAEKTLPRPASLQPWVDFWIDVYGRHHDGVLTLHDSRDAGIVYATLETPRGQSLRDRRLRAEPEIDAFREALLDVAEGERRARTPYHDRVLALWGPDANPLTLRAAAEHIRFQVGHAEAFRDALSRSRVWRPWINRVLTAHRLPRELGAIPFVESFFRPDVAPSSGARGIWQFTLQAGQRDMHIGDGIDERLSFYKSTLAAARLLSHNLSITRRWPLAVTAYNHGTPGMIRAVRQLDTRDFGLIARQYSHPEFGFASRNFYAQVLAAAYVEAHQSRFFSALPPVSPRPTRFALTLSEPRSLREISVEQDVSLAGLASANPDILDPQYRQHKRLPAGFTVFVNCINDCPDEQSNAVETPSGNGPTRYTVRSGDTLGHIAVRVDSTVAELARVNRLDPNEPLAIGRTLDVPGAEADLSFLQFPPELRLDKPFDARAASTRQTQAMQPAQQDNFSALTAALLAARPPVPDAASETVVLPDTAQYALLPDSRLALLHGESTGLIARWLDIDTQSLHTLNGLARDAVLDVGHVLYLAFDHVPRAEFERRRLRHHRDKQYAWYARWQIDGTLEHEIAPGDRLWRIAQQRYNVPQWLLLEYNPDLDFTRIRPGSRLTVPRARPRETPSDDPSTG